MSAPDQNWWNYYVTLTRPQIISLTDPTSTSYDPIFTQKLATAFSQKLFGFQDYTGSCAGPNNGGNKFIGNT
jgi:hypothetical protein